MSAFKHVWHFRDINGSSWSEVWYREAGNLEDAATIKNDILLLRETFLDKLHTFRSITVSDVSNARNTKQILLNDKGTSGGTGGPADPEDSIVCSLTATGGGKRKWWLRGNSRSDFARSATSGADQPPPAFAGNLSAFIQSMKNASFGILRLKPVATRNPPGYYAVQSVAANIDGTTSIVVAAPNGSLFTNKRVILSRFDPKLFPALNGRYQVVSTTTTNIVVNYKIASGSGENTPGARVAVEEFDPVHIFDPAGCGFDHYGSHDTKNPNTSSRGARRAKRLRLL